MKIGIEEETVEYWAVYNLVSIVSTPLSDSAEDSASSTAKDENLGVFPSCEAAFEAVAAIGKDSEDANQSAESGSLKPVKCARFEDARRIANGELNPGGTVFLAVFIAEDQEQAEPNRSGVFGQKSEAEKVMKAEKAKFPRFKEFSDFASAEYFSLTGTTNNPSGRTRHRRRSLGLEDPEMDQSNFTADSPAPPATSAAGQSSTKSKTGEEVPLPFSAPTRQDLMKLRQAIEKQRTEEAAGIVWQNPRYLINTVGGDSATLLHEGPRYNALHIAARSKSFEGARLVLDTCSDLAYIAMLYVADGQPQLEDRQNILRASYLNTPDKPSFRTPLHWAVKNGAHEVVSLLLDQPETQLLPIDKHGDTPVHIAIAEKNLSIFQQLITDPRFCPSDGDLVGKLEKCIDDSLKSPNIARFKNILANPRELDEFYVALYRDFDFSRRPEIQVTKGDVPLQICDTNSRMPKSGANFGGSNSSMGNLNGRVTPPPRPSAQNNSAVDVEESLFLAAAIGPCPESAARSLAREWAKESASKEWRSLKLTDIHKGMERIGRQLAVTHGLKWREYWPFERLMSADGSTGSTEQSTIVPSRKSAADVSENYLDLSTPEGLASLEGFLSSRKAKSTIAMSRRVRIGKSGSPYAPASTRLLGATFSPSKFRGSTGRRIEALKGEPKRLLNFDLADDRPSPLAKGNQLAREDAVIKNDRVPDSEHAIDSEDEFYDSQTDFDDYVSCEVHGPTEDLSQNGSQMEQQCECNEAVQISKLTGDLNLPKILDLMGQIDQPECSDSQLADNPGNSGSNQIPSDTEESEFEVPPDMPEIPLDFIAGPKPSKLDEDILKAIQQNPGSYPNDSRSRDQPGLANPGSADNGGLNPGLKTEDLQSYPHVRRWLNSVKFYSSEERRSWPGLDSRRYAQE